VGVVVACAALALALVSTALWWRTVRLLDGLTVQLTQLEHQDAQALAAWCRPALRRWRPRERRSLPRQVCNARAGAGHPERQQAVGDTSALRGRRAWRSATRGHQQASLRLARQKVSGVVDIRTYAGRFCLVVTRSTDTPWRRDETLFTKCDVVANPSDDALSSTQRTSLALANLIGDIRSSTHGRSRCRWPQATPGVSPVPYPPVVSELAAGDWNRAASANNRVEIRVH